MARRELVDRSERVARQLADACFAAWGTIDRAAPGTTRTANLIMDCSYLASTTARLLGHADEYPPHLLAMHVEVCRGVARQCQRTCDGHPDLMLASCAHAAWLAVRGFDELLADLGHSRAGEDAGARRRAVR